MNTPSTPPTGSRRLFSGLFNRRVLRRGLIVLAWFVTLIAVFYGEENWRGRHRWNNYSDALKGQGDQLDLSAFIPRPIPDAENFADTPLINSWFVLNTNLEIRGRFTNQWDKDPFEMASEMVADDGEAEYPQPHLTDLVAWSMALEAVRVGTNGLHHFNSEKFDRESRAKAAPVVLENLKFLDAPVKELRAVADRPHTRYPIIYDLNDPWGILLPHMSNLQRLSKRLQLRSSAYLALGESDHAIEDVKLLLRLSDSLKEEPFLISYLVRNNIIRYTLQPIWEGLAERRWSETQLKELQALIARYDFLAEVKLHLDCERASGILTAELLQRRAFRLSNLMTGNDPVGFLAANAIAQIIPSGWWDLDKLNYSRLYQLQLAGTYDAQNRRVFPHRIDENWKGVEEAWGGGRTVIKTFMHHEFLAKNMLPALRKVPARSALAQVRADQGVIACALERYRLAHGQYPDTLLALQPDFISEIPHDVLSGELYKYHRTTDGSFVLYSVGWNEKDDGGQIIPTKNSFDALNGDWVWQYSNK